ENLPEKCREIFIRSRFDNKKNSEIAAELGISEKTVENQMTIALKKLRAELAHYMH
ncbi:MAG: RNA polymerase sigma-70 factor, partial [Bacteroidales bacterium]|nr:RNA polymerase sigma-70 factor [Bacteroidales bacterium]